MAQSAPTTARALALAVILRALPLLAAGLVITFTADHSARIGLLVLGILTGALAVSLGIPAVRLTKTEPLRALHGMLALIALLTSLLALSRLDGGLPFLLVIVSGWAVLSGAGELVWGIRHRRRHPLARDAMVVGTATLALAVIYAIVADPVSAVGFLGAYAVIVAVFLTIAALSLLWGPSPKEHTRP
jgi:hypothetical protein